MITSDLLKRLPSVIKKHGPSVDLELIINTDSRNFKAGETFVALSGDNFDGFNYVEQVLKQGARAVILTSIPSRTKKIDEFAKDFPDVLIVETIDALICIQQLASSYVTQWKKNKIERKIIGITGSNGKTTHKEMMFHLLNSAMPGKVLATKGNLNNHIGVPLTIFNLNESHDIAIIEMGMNHPGEIETLCKIAHPEHGMITNIGTAHIEFMNSIENIFLEKSCLYQAVLKNSNEHGVFVVNGDDPFLAKLSPTAGLVVYGEIKAEVKIKIEMQNILFELDDRQFFISNEHLPEHHNLKNLAGVAIFAIKLFPEFASAFELAAGLYQQPQMNRSQWINHIFLDAYNANPSSMKVSIDSFINIMKQKDVSIDDCYFVIGDMNELGSHAAELHQDIAQHLLACGIKNVTFIGRYKEFYKQGYPNPKSDYLKKEEFYPEWKTIKNNYKFVFVKASRSLQLETLVSIV